MKKSSLKVVMACVGIFGMVSVFSSLTSCKKSDDTLAVVVTKSLYDSLGGTTLKVDPRSSTGSMIETGKLNLRSVVDSTIFVIAADSLLNNKFFSVLLGEVKANNLTGFSELSQNLTEFFSSATGSKTIKYTGMDMATAHNPAKNNRMGTKAASADFDQFVADLAKGAKQNGVPDSLVNYHIAPLVYSLKSVVVQK